MYRELYRSLSAVRDRYPWLRPAARTVNRLLRLRPPTRFSGWGMTTQHELPWVDDHEWQEFREARRRVRAFTFTGDSGIETSTLGELDWRHWIVAWAARYALTYSPPGVCADFVECGVADGTTSFFALTEIAAHEKRTGEPRRRRIHLYDAWRAMSDHDLTREERVQAGRYATLSLEATQRNLAPFAERCEWHVGHIPESLADRPPERIAFLHVDLNASRPTLRACEYFWPRLVPGGVMLFDDYGWLGFVDTKAAIDGFFVDRPGLLLKFPTGQAAFLRR